MSEYHEITGKVVHNQPMEQAVLIDFDGDGDPTWVPRSMFEDDTGRMPEGDIVTTGIEAWWLVQEGLI